jgi:transcriptional regulator with XRE-family HTH domain
MCFVILSELALITGSQLAAARILAQMDQYQLAEKAGVQQATLSRWERFGAAQIRAQTDKLHLVQTVLETAGIEFLNDDAPGVRLRPKSKR